MPPRGNNKVQNRGSITIESIPQDVAITGAAAIAQARSAIEIRRLSSTANGHEDRIAQSLEVIVYQLEMFAKIVEKASKVGSVVLVKSLLMCDRGRSIHISISHGMLHLPCTRQACPRRLIILSL